MTQITTQKTQTVAPNEYMVQFAKEYPNVIISQEAVGQIPCGHNILLLQKLSSLEERLWYADKIIENGWSQAEYEVKIVESLPEGLKGSLPTIKEIKRELEDQRVLTEWDNR